MKPELRSKVFIAVSPFVGMAYGLLMRLAFTSSQTHAAARSTGAELPAAPVDPTMFAGAMSVAFLFIVPFVMGALFVLIYPRDKKLSWPLALGGAAIAASLWYVGATLLMLEGLICLVMMAPVFFGMSLLGAAAAKTYRSLRIENGDASTTRPLAFVLVLPLLVGVAEARLRAPVETRVVTNVVTIDATPDIVWDHIKSVEAIDASELPFSFSHLIGLPRPIAATLDVDGVGGVRMASFERGLVFREVVTEFEPERAIAFTIHTEEAPPTALDEHIVVGGRYFDVLDGKYTMRRVDADTVELTLTSTQRISTTLNFYATLWTDYVMFDLQRVIMEVIKKRCEDEMGASYAMR